MSHLRFAFRRLCKSPGFAAIAILTLGLGIGASTALFTVVNGVLLRPLAFREQAQLVWLREHMSNFGNQPLPINARHFVRWRESATSFSHLAVMHPGLVNLTGVERPQHLRSMAVSASFFELLGSFPLLGRTFRLEEETQGNDRVVILTHSLWRQRFEADPAIIGKTVQLDGTPHEIVGVLPDSFHLPVMAAMGATAGQAEPEIYWPKTFSADEMRELLGRHNYSAIGRLKPGVTLQQAETELNELGAGIVREAGQPGASLRALVYPLRETIVGPARRGLLVLFGAVTAVLLIGCLNLTNFLLAQAETRKHEAALRLALGATRQRVMAQSLLEALLVSGLGGIVGVALAYIGVDALLQHAPAEIPRLKEVTVDARVLLFSLGLSLVCGVLVGIVPSWRLAKADPQQALAAGSRSIAKGGRGLAGLLISLEVGISVALLATAALLAGSFMRILKAEKGFDAPAVLTAQITISTAKYTSGDQRLGYFESLLQRLERMPGVASAAITNTLPLQGEMWVEKAAVAGDPRPTQEKLNTNVRFVSREYFNTLGIRLLAGRTHTESDRGHNRVVMSQSLAKALWPGQEAIGRQYERWPGDAAEVIGVVGDVRANAAQPPVHVVYRPHWDWPARRAMIAVRASGDARIAGGSLRAALTAVDSEVPVPHFQTMDDILHGSVAQQRFHVLLAGVFATTALLLTALGIYGVVAYAVSRRQKEIGIRMAFGAAPAAVSGLMLRQGMRPVVTGLAAGLAASLAGGRVIASLLYETQTDDPATLGAVVLALLLVGAAACYLPSRRATRVDPMQALRSE